MASQTIRPMLGVYKTPGVVHVAGSFNLPAEDPTSVYGYGFSVSYVQTGVYKVTLDEKFPMAIAVTMGLGYNVAGGPQHTTWDIDSFPFSEVTFRMYRGGVAYAYGASVYLSFDILASFTSVNKVRTP